MRCFVILAAVALGWTATAPACAATSSIHCTDVDSSANRQSENKACGFYQQSLSLQLHGKLDAAVVGYTSAIGWMSNFGEAYAARGDAYEYLGEHEKSAADYAQAARLNQKNAEALNGVCWERAKRGYPLPLALNSCDAAIKLEPDLWAAWDSRCLVNYRLGNYSAAISDCDKAEGLWKDVGWDMKTERRDLRAGTLYVRGLAKIKNGNVDDGNADIVAAKDTYSHIGEEYATFGVTR